KRTAATKTEQALTIRALPHGNSFTRIEPLPRIKDSRDCARAKLLFQAFWRISEQMLSDIFVPLARQTVDFTGWAQNLTTELFDHPSQLLDQAGGHDDELLVGSLR